MKTPQKLDFKHFFFTRLVQRTPPPLFVQGWILLQACDYITSHLWCSFISQALLSQLFEEPAGGLWSERAQWPPSLADPISSGGTFVLNPEPDSKATSLSQVWLVMCNEVKGEGRASTQAVNPDKTTACVWKIPHK